MKSTVGSLFSGIGGFDLHEPPGGLGKLAVASAPFSMVAMWASQDAIVGSCWATLAHRNDMIQLQVISKYRTAVVASPSLSLKECRGRQEWADSVVPDPSGTFRVLASPLFAALRSLAVVSLILALSGCIIGVGSLAVANVIAYSRVSLWRRVIDILIFASPRFVGGVFSSPCLTHTVTRLAPRTKTRFLSAVLVEGVGGFSLSTLTTTFWGYTRGIWHRSTLSFAGGGRWVVSGGHLYYTSHDL